MSINTRLATGIALVVLGVIVDFLPQTLFSACIGVVALLGAREWASLSGLTRPWQQLLCVAVIALLGALVWAIEATLSVPLAIAASFLWLAALAAVVGTQLGRFDLAHWPGLRLLCGVGVLVPAWSSLAHLHQGPHGPWQVLILLLLVWSADIAAYFAGRRWGRRKLCPAVSPGKSVEGALAGLAAALLLGVVIAGLQNPPMPAMVRFALLAVAVAAVSILGDLFESIVKRSANMKDSGTLLPGHGGVLDRIDSLTAAAPVYVVGLQIAGVGS